MLQQYLWQEHGVGTAWCIPKSLIGKNAVDGPAGGHGGLPVLPRHEVEGVPDQMLDAGLDKGLGKHGCVIEHQHAARQNI